MFAVVFAIIGIGVLCWFISSMLLVGEFSKAKEENRKMRPMYIVFFIASILLVVAPVVFIIVFALTF